MPFAEGLLGLLLCFVDYEHSYCYNIPEQVLCELTLNFPRANTLG